ncbi:histidinol-phosphate transaminase [Coralloluteibacterium stylophorae]|uniref:Histidinol-phosphate aminotransferase n=1 Tax=Coralloluteibacterium stylophorae TaxID=1776034 RepID=A0A8J7VUQ2_9GAMM|nr:histidinol-phosphate transaminase [Coralloluteibacterium stylophorae]MBS7455888.1 histidinol-phosphate transaminase [Coralloluteibacterium stylophorae]
MSVLDLVREDLRAFGGYSSARREGGQGRVWLNANESPWRAVADSDPQSPGLNRYPQPQPEALVARLAALYGVGPGRLAATRGSDEGIDLLVRALCRAGQDAVLIAPPTFGMYAVAARVQAAPLVEVPLRETDAGWGVDAEAVVAAARERNVRLVFLCSPNNPTGEIVPLATVAGIASALARQAVVVVDEAYAEFADPGASAVGLLGAHPNLVVLRTLSKAHALAGARIGNVLGDPALVRVLRNISAPYPLPAPSVALALAALDDFALQSTRSRIGQVVHERERLATALAAAPGVRRVHPSDANFLLVRFADADAALRALADAGVVVRDMRHLPGLDDALRITVGAPLENDAVLDALGVVRQAGAA